MQEIIVRLQEATKTTREHDITDIKNALMPEQYESHSRLVTATLSSLPLISLITPVNYNAEREKFLKASGNIHPTFEYDEKRFHQVELQFEDEGKFLWRDYPDLQDGTIRKLMVSLLENRARSACATAELIEAIRKSSHWANQLVLEKYGTLTDDLHITALAMADDLCYGERIQPRPTALSDEDQNRLALMVLDANELKEWFEWSLEQYGFEIPVVTSRSAAYINVGSNENGIIVTIPESTTCSGKEAIFLVRHEIECHIRDRMNAQALLRPYGMKDGLGFIDSDVLAEGHALYEENKLSKEFFGMPKEPVPWYAVAIDSAKHGEGFVQTATRLHEYLEDAGDLHPLELAWKYTYRVYRGSKNVFPAEEPFVFTKDKAYLEGYLLAEELDKAGLYHWLNLGGLRPDELVEIAETVNFEPEHVVYQDKHTAESMIELLLNN